jgi:hypothetical protein
MEIKMEENQKKEENQAVGSTVLSATSGGDSTQAGRDLTQKESSNKGSNNRIIVSFVTIIAFGGLAMAVYFAKDMNNHNCPSQTIEHSQPNRKK